MDKCLLEHAIGSVIDYGQVMSCLSAYKAPHRKITGLLKKAELIRIKKGLYILGEDFRQEPLSLEFIANLIYGPSYVSQEYALQYYGLIPERVETITSMSSKRHKYFSTPLGHFQYTYLNQQRFTVGVDWLQIRKNITILIASPEKALVDTLAKYRDVTRQKEMRALLLENLRLEEDELAALDLSRLEKICESYRHPTASLFLKTLLRGL